MSNSLDRNDALEILKLALDDIERIKQQQWRDFYAVLAVQGGLLVLFSRCLILAARRLRPLPYSSLECALALLFP
jgi:hypothetical protein